MIRIHPYYFLEKFRKIGLDTPNRMAAASDEMLLNTKGVGPVALRKLRKICEKITENRGSARFENVRRYIPFFLKNISKESKKIEALLTITQILALYLLYSDSMELKINFAIDMGH